MAKQKLDSKEKKLLIKKLIDENKDFLKGKKKYDISDEFGIFKLYKLPFNEITFKASDRLLELLPSKFLKSDDDVKISTKSIKTVDKTKINLYIFENKKIATDKVILYIHGGGFVYRGSKNQFDLCRRFALDGTYKVVFVDYRLAYNNEFPTCINDSFSAYKWIIRNKKRLKIDPKKIVLCGDSAGGCLCVDVANMAKKEKAIPPAYMMLLYPVLDKRMNTESIKKYTNTPIWNSVLNKKMWELYLKDVEYTSPNELEDMTHLPNAYIETAEFDCLHDEAVDFASKLKKCGKNVILNETKHTMHGFDMKECKITEEAIEERLEILKKVFKKEKSR